MRVPRQFNFPPLDSAPGAPPWFRDFLENQGRYLKRIALSLTGPKWFDLGNVSATVTVKPEIADLVVATLTANTAITLSMTDVRKGDEGLLELAQDGVGGWVPTWTNLIGAVPAVSATALKRTMIGLTHRGDGWVAYVRQAGY